METNSTTALVQQPAAAAAPAADIAITSAPRRPTGIIPTTAAECALLADAFAKSGMFAVKTAESALTVLMTGLELGLMPAQSMRAIHVIEGKPVLAADAMIAIALARPEICEHFVCVETTTERATYRTRRSGSSSPVEVTFTMADAQRAGLANRDVWRKYPAPLLRARAASALARIAYPDLLLGLYTPEEARSIANRDLASDELAEMLEGDAVDAPPALAASASRQAPSAEIDDARSGLEQAPQLEQPAQQNPSPETNELRHLRSRRAQLVARIKDLGPDEKTVVMAAFDQAFGGRHMPSVLKIGEIGRCFQALDAMADDPFADLLPYLKYDGPVAAESSEPQ